MKKDRMSDSEYAAWKNRKNIRDIESLMGARNSCCTGRRTYVPSMREVEKKNRAFAQSVARKILDSSS